MQKLVTEAIAAHADHIDSDALSYTQVRLYRAAAQIGATQTAAPFGHPG